MQKAITDVNAKRFGFEYRFAGCQPSKETSKFV